MSNLNHTVFTIACPVCGKQLDFSPHDTSHSLICPKCQCKIMFDTSDFLGGLQEADQLIDDLLWDLK